VTDPKNKPGLDEQTFAKLLEAAYVLQEHNREMRQMEESLELHSEQLRQQEADALAAMQKSSQRAEENSRPESDYTLTLAEIVEAQHQIQIRHLESDKAMAVVAERVARITKASGAGIAILEGKTVHYRAGAGAPALPLGSEAPLETAICAICLRTGQVLRTPDVDTEFLFDPDLCRQREIQSLVAVPIYHNGNIVGALELYFDRLRGFAEQDIHTCQLMAGLVTEAIGRGAESALKKSMAEERSSMLAAIEKLQPNLAVLAEQRAAGPTTKNPGVNAVSVEENFFCWKCSSKLMREEQFCGKCGAPRVGDSDESSMQSKVASAFQMQPAGHESPASPRHGTPPQTAARAAAARENPAKAAADNSTQHKLLRSRSRSVASLNDHEAFTSAASTDTDTDKDAIQVRSSTVPEPRKNDLEAAPVSLAKHQQVAWSSAAKARDFLEALGETRSPSALARFWRARRGDFYLAVAIILVVAVIRWGIFSGHPVGANGTGTAVSGSANPRKPPAPDADLSMFDKLLISLGLAEAPEAPEYKDKGNPDTQVWIDPHTALYYCPGSDLYGKTDKGKFASQRDAQMDQFEPAFRKACD
jgi:putative methionine-R-sulfoxide reductase with GAF domain